MSDKQLFQEVDWHGKKLFICPICKTDSFDKKVMLKHLVDAHNSELALVQLVELEGNAPSSQNSLFEQGAADEETGKDVFEVVLVETGTTVDAHGNEQKNYTVKE